MAERQIAQPKMVGREMPHSLESEVALLGSILLRPTSIERVYDIVRPGDFYRLAHRTIYEAMVRLYNEREAIDVVTLTTELEKQDQLGSAGGVEFLVELSEAVPTSHNIVSYANIIADKAMLRDLLETTWEIIDEGYSATKEVREIVDEAESKVFQVGQREIRTSTVTIEDMVHASLDSIDKAMKEFKSGNVITGVPSGFTDLDDITKGFQGGDLLILAARPSMGKTAFALNIATHIASEVKKPAIVFTMEMNARICTLRMLASMAKVDLGRLRVGDLSNEEYKKLQGAGSLLHDAPLFIDDTGMVSTDEIRAKCRRIKADKGLGMVVIDYIQLMKARDLRAPREQQVADISRSLKAIAKEMDVPVMALSQLNRGVENRDDKRPRMADIRESGAVEQDADLIMFLYRDEYYLEKQKKFYEAEEKLDVWQQKMDECLGVAEVIISKHRNGMTGTVDLSFVKECTVFQNLEKRHDSPF